MKRLVTRSGLIDTAKAFCQESHIYPELFGVTDGKAVGTFIEHRFQERLAERYTVEVGSSARGIDLPSVETDIKVTSARQPQSSCPFRSARQKIYGLGYLTVSNALQWRLQYRRIVKLTETVSGIVKIV